MLTNRKPLGLLALIAVSAILVSALVAVNVDARGANANGKKGGGATTTGTCWFNPNPVGSGQTVTTNGSGFPANSTIGVTVSGPFGTSVGFIQSNEAGGFSYDGTTGSPGTYTAKFSGGNAVANCTLQVN